MILKDIFTISKNNKKNSEFISQASKLLLKKKEFSSKTRPTLCGYFKHLFATLDANG